MILSHVLEHMSTQEAIELIELYLPYLSSKAQVIMITPQEKGYTSDSTHVEFMDFARLKLIASKLKLSIQREYSFPFPRFFGKSFIYNEFVMISNKSNSQEISCVGF